MAPAQTCGHRLQIRRRFREAAFVEANNRDEALKQCELASPDLIVLDSDLDDCDGLQLIESFSKIVPIFKIVVYSGFVDPFTIHRVGSSRAHGFVAKGEKAGELGEAAVVISAGGRYYSEYVRRVLQELATDQHAFVSRLTDREMELLGEFGCSLSNDEVAAKYALSDGTVRNHRAKITGKLEIFINFDDRSLRRALLFELLGVGLCRILSEHGMGCDDPHWLW